MKRLTQVCGRTAAAVLLSTLAAACGAGLTPASPGAKAATAITSTITATSTSGCCVTPVLLPPPVPLVSPTPVDVLGSTLSLSYANAGAAFRVGVGTVIRVHFSATPPGQVGVPMTSDPQVLPTLPGLEIRTYSVSVSFRAAQGGVAKLTMLPPPCGTGCGGEDGVSEWLVTILVHS